MCVCVCGGGEGGGVNEHGLNTAVAVHSTVATTRSDKFFYELGQFILRTRIIHLNQLTSPYLTASSSART
jgi:hypothetical protein